MAKFHSLAKTILCELSVLNYIIFFDTQKCMKYYFKYWKAIHRTNSAKLDPGSNERKYRIILILKIICLLTILASITMLVLTLMPENSIYWRALLWDQMLFQGVRPALNLIWVLCGFSCTFIYHRMYMYGSNERKAGRETVWLTMQFLKKGDRRFPHEPLMQIDCGKLRKILAFILQILSPKYFCKFGPIIFTMTQCVQSVYSDIRIFE